MVKSKNYNFSKKSFLIFIGAGINQIFFPWRFSFRVNKKIRNKLLSEVRKNGYDISSWYPGVRKFSHLWKKTSNSGFFNFREN